MKYNEINIIRKRGRPTDIRVAIAYPSIYEVAMSSLAYQMIYFYVNSRENYIGERYILNKEKEKILSIESGNHLANNDLIIFSIHYELDYVNIIKMLMKSKIEIFSHKRNKPIIVIGGPPIIANPEPLSHIADVLLLGEIEPIFPNILDLYAEYRDSKKRFLESLSPNEGFYVPSQNPTEIKVAYASTLLLDFHPIAQIQSLNKEHTWMRSTIIEAMRGCLRKCRFCLEGNIFWNKRDRPLSQIKEIALKGREYNRTSNIVLYSLSFFDHKESDNVLEFLIDEKFSFSVPSMRIETLNEKRLELIHKGGQKMLTIAPETVSRKLSIFLGKASPQEMIENIVLLARKNGFTSLKMYFIIGIPGEKLEDIKRNIYFIKDIAQKTGYKGEKQLKISITPFIPKPHTPLESYPFEDIRILMKKIKLFKKELGSIADIREYSPKHAQIQTILSRGNRELSKTLVLWAYYGGNLGAWKKAIKENNINVKKYLDNLEPPYPWHKIKIK